MRILFLSSLYPPDTRGGGELSTHFIAQGLVERGHQVTVITTAPKLRTSELDGVNIMRLPLPLTAKPLFEERHSKKMAKQLLQHINAESYDIIHTHDFRTA
ncbi:MAG: glycosyltransferase, partial [Candidatus Andersenbacteria bacterium]